MTEEKKFYCYILRCHDNSLYTGWTLDPQNRLQAHNRGTASAYTNSRKPVEMVHLEVFSSKSDAMKREYAIKQMTREEKLRLIEMDKTESTGNND